MMRQLSSVLVCLTLAAGCGGDTAVSNTPERVIRQLQEGFKKHDWGRVLDAFIEEDRPLVVGMTYATSVLLASYARVVTTMAEDEPPLREEHRETFESFRRFPARLARIEVKHGLDRKDLREKVGSGSLKDLEKTRAFWHEHLAGKNLPSLLGDLMLCLDDVHIPGQQEEGILAEMEKMHEGRVVDVRIDEDLAVVILDEGEKVNKVYLRKRKGRWFIDTSATFKSSE